ncbi:MAG: DUF308 domain-containing protein [Candidatus Heritagella sp.]
MNVKKRFSSGIFVCLFELLIGILLLINPTAFTTGIIIAMGAVLCFAGLRAVIRYFRMDAQEAAVSQLLFKGLLFLLLGIFCIVQSSWFIATFPILAILYGITILLSGLGKTEAAVNALRTRRKWILPAVSAAISLLCSVIILSNPFTSTTVLWMFTGIVLIVQAIADFSVWVTGRGEGQKEEDT